MTEVGSAMNKTYFIRYVEIENFRQYRKTRIEFSTDTQKPFTIIRGANGTGKTTIMNAITWCLYGKEVHRQDGGRNDDKVFPTININALKEKPVGIINMSVTIMFADKSGDQMKITRKLSLYSEGEFTIELDGETGMWLPRGSSSTLDVTKKCQRYTRNGWEDITFGKGVSILLPESLVSYHLFDGEKLEDFFNELDNIKNGIKDVSKIKMVEQAIESLEKFIKQRIQQRLKNLKPKANKYRTLLDEATDRRKETIIEIDKISNILKTKKEQIDELEQFIIIHGGINIKKQQEQAIEIKKGIAKIQKEHNNKRLELRDYVLMHMPGVMLHTQIQDTVEQIEKKGQAGVLPPKISGPFLEKLLKNELCICGNNIAQGTLARENVSKYMKSAGYSVISNTATDILYTLKPLLDMNKIISKLDTLQTELSDIQDREEDEKEKYKELQDEIGNADVDLIKRKQSEKISLENDVARLNQDLGAYKSEENKLANAEKDHRVNLSIELKKDGRYKETSDKNDFCMNALTNLAKIKKVVLEEAKSKVQTYTEQYFLDLLWKEGIYDGINIDENYRITVHHKYGYYVRTELSKGEKLVLALSFMAALRQITGFGFPLLIDTPLGRVSGEPRYNIACKLPEFLQNTQTTLLVTDSEYQAPVKDDDGTTRFPSIRDGICKYVGKDYTIHFKNNESIVNESVVNK